MNDASTRPAGVGASTPALLGVDVGGTFTDFYYLADGAVQVHKRPSTPHNPAEAILRGIEERGWRPSLLVHGSTIATNAVLERKGARVVFVATAGFRDLLAIGRQARPRIYELQPSRPPPLVPSDLCFEVEERLDYRGEVLTELTDAAIERLVEAVRDAGPDAVAVCLLFSFLNPTHERRIGAALREAGLEVSLSSEVLPEPREYERAMTTVLNAYVAPRMRGYLSALEADLKARAGCERLSVIQSSGGTLSAAQAGSLAAATLLSGPAAGVAGAFAVASRAGFDQVVTLDMGGTSTDVCLCPGRIPYTADWSVADLPVRLPAVDVHTVGAGGGSIARRDEGGALRVGPQSAGADPGPAAYGRGGPATVTDAHLTLGRLDASSFLGGDFAVEPERAVEAMRGLGLGSPAAAAAGVIAVANTLMAQALRVVSAERGYDPAAFTLLAFGGAGPLHACELAEALGMPRVLVPRHPGVLSALGAVWAEPVRDYSAPLGVSVSAADDASVRSSLQQRLDSLVKRAGVEMGAAAALEVAVDLRYAGQGYELTVASHQSSVISHQSEPVSVAKLLEAFHAEHRRRFGHADPTRTVELVTLRLRARLPSSRPEETPLPDGPADASAALAGRRSLTLGRRRHDAPVYDRERLLAGNRIDGAAIVTQMDSTTLLLPGWRLQVGSWGDLVLERR